MTEVTFFEDGRWVTRKATPVPRCGYVWHRPVWPVENGRAAFEAEREAKMTPEELAERERVYSLLEGQSCVAPHPTTEERCSQPDCSFAEYFAVWAADEFHAFIVDGEEFITSNGVNCWDCWREDCGYTREERA